MVGAHEVRTWVAAAAAARKMGDVRPELRYYHLVKEWITGIDVGVTQGDRIQGRVTTDRLARARRPAASNQKAPEIFYRRFWSAWPDASPATAPGCLIGL